MLTDIQKSNMKSFLENDYGLTVCSIRNEKHDDYYKIFCEYANKKVVIKLVKNRDDDRYRMWIDINAYMFVPKFVNVLDNHEGYQALSLLGTLIDYSLFKIKQNVYMMYIAESTFVRKQKHVAQFNVMTIFQFSDSPHSIHNITAGVTKFSKKETVFDDDFATNFYREPRIRPVNHVDFNLTFKNKNDIKMVQDVLFSNYIKYMNVIKPFRFGHDDINDISSLDHVEAAYRINANISIQDMVAI